MNAGEAKEMFCFMAEQLIAQEEFLTEIDNKIGDGDHGTGMAAGMKGVLKALRARDFNTVNEVFHTCGMTFLRETGGASGVLFGTVFISGISAYPEKSDFASEDFAAVFAGSLTALKKRGKAQVGDKTMIDALEPAVTALWAHRGESVKSAFTAAAEAARAGMEYTKTIPAKFGRARYYGEKAVGIQDPGATSVWLIWRAMATWTENHAV